MTLDVKICKVDNSEKHTEVEGALLTLTGLDKDGNIVSFGVQSLELGEGAESLSASGARLVWKSGKTSPKLATIWKMWSNELNIIDALLSFFADKDSDCVESLKHTKVACLMSCLGQSYAHRTRKKYNQLAAALYAMPKPYFSKAQFCRPHEYVLYRFYDSRLVYRAIVKVLSKVRSLLNIAG